MMLRWGREVEVNGKKQKKGSIKREHVRNKLVFKMVKGPAVGRQEGIKGNKVKNSS